MTERIEEIRKRVSSSLDKKNQSKLGQFFTPMEIARFMASLFQISEKKEISLLDAGAGVGSLSCAFIERIFEQKTKNLHITAYEVDKDIMPALSNSLELCQKILDSKGSKLSIEKINADFIQDVVVKSHSGANQEYDYAILNPPYKKINSKSTHRSLLRKVHVETVNLYSAFVALALKLLRPKGQLVAIIPRSFCNGPYYRQFRELILSNASIKHIHLFEARNKAFGEDGVLQENVIIYLSKGLPQDKTVSISTSRDGKFDNYKKWEVPFEEIVKEGDSENFIHIPYHQGRSRLNQSKKIFSSLDELGCKVSTGPVVDFRSKEFLRKMVEGDSTAPLIYPAHFNGWRINHPLEGFKKYNGILINDKTARQLFARGHYALVRRFSSKEEKRRIVARVIRKEDICSDFVGFENHLNVFHINKQGLSEDLAFGLATYLNSKQVDEYFRLFSGHTQVNATDLRLLKYPCEADLIKLGKWAKTQIEFSLEEIDKQVEKIL
jgi:adenine-specific DNA-methyltransferase